MLKTSRTSPPRSISTSCLVGSARGLPLLKLIGVLVIGAALSGCGDGAGGPGCMTEECRALCEQNPTDPICRPACSTKTSCTVRGKDCGSLDDGCGGSLDCGSCSNGLTCGGGGTSNLCGASCGAGCPTGYSCDNLGVCKGGTPTGLVLDVKTFAVAGKVTLNGAPPTSSCGTVSPATVLFQELQRGYSISVPVPCDPAFTWSGQIYPGTYKVTVSGNANSNLPQGTPFVVNPALVLDANQTGLVLDVKTVALDGKVTLNGAAPTSSCGTVSPATVLLHEVTQGYDLSILVPCNPTFAFSGTLYPGTYKVSVSGNANSNLPQGTAFVANQALVLTGNQTGQVLDVKTVTLDGKVTLNGAAPTSSCGTVSPATVLLQEVTQGYNLSIPVPCNPTFAFSGALYPGTYKVSVSGNANSNLPQGTAFVANQALVLTGNQTGQVLDVKTVTLDGKVTLNGAVPTSSCGTVSPATVFLQEVTQGYSLTIPVPCNPTFSFLGTLYPGTYKVSVSGNANSNLPQGTAFVANPALVLTANQTGQVLNVKTVTLDGAVTLNGVAPTSSCGTASPATIQLLELNYKYSLSIPVSCSPTFAFTGTLYPGTYKVSVSGNANSNLPQGAAFVANRSLVLTSNQSAQILDVKTVAVDGKITLNAAVPTTSCGTASPATVLFTEIADGYTLSTAVPCNPTFSFMTSVYPGTYRVSVSGNANSNLPQGARFVAVERLLIP